jgi:hypothetical protein
MMACCFFTVLLLNEGLIPTQDLKGNAVLVSVSLMKDAERDDSEWNAKESDFKAKAGKLLSEARKRGFFLDKSNSIIVQ